MGDGESFGIACSTIGVSCKREQSELYVSGRETEKRRRDRNEPLKTTLEDRRTCR